MKVSGKLHGAENPKESSMFGKRFFPVKIEGASSKAN